MAHHDDLLQLAIRLAGPPPGPGVPSPATAPADEADARRAISTAYYAVFHLLIHAATSRSVPTVDLRPHVARNFEHRSMMSVCRRYSSLTTDLIGQPVPPELRRLAERFVLLQSARNKADYNLKEVVTAADAQTFVQQARDAFTDWHTVASHVAADTFLTELLMGGIKDR